MSFTTHTAVAELATVDVSFETLGARLTGSVHTPGDPRYDALVSPWNLAVAVQPAAVVDARTAEDVVEAVRFAGAHGLTAGVQATGHGAIPGIAGHLLIATKGLDELAVHPEGWARVGAGVKWLPVIEAAAPLRARGAQRLLERRRHRRLHHRRRRRADGPHLRHRRRPGARLRRRHR